MMKYWKMKLTCQSPVHIGSGDIYQKNQYVYEEDGKRAHIYFLNESKWAEFLENEKLLDSFFEEAAWDISSDISVLHNMFAQEGLTESDFDKVKVKR